MPTASSMPSLACSSTDPVLTVRDFLMPDLGEGLTEGEINRWLVAEGDVVVVDQPIAEITTEKAVVEVPTPFAGRVAVLHGAAGESIAVGTPLISIEVAGAPSEGASGNVLVGYGTSESAPRARRSLTPAPAGVAKPASASPPASPLVRRLAGELGIDLASVSGSGPGGMVTRADLEQVASRQSASPATENSPPSDGSVRIALTGVDRIAAERLTRSHHDAPSASAWLSADATRLMELRAELPAGSSDASVTPFAIILRLCVVALRKFPRLNAHFDTETNEVVRFTPVHLGVAVQTDRGLVVAVIREAQSRSLRGIADELQRLAGAARDGSIDATDLRGSTFTVSNFGAFGVDGGTAIINPPEAAILGVGRISTRPWVVDDEVVPRSIVELSLVFDHRVADGGVAGGFIRHLANLIETPDEAMTDD
jgi:2-oxoisovalerate dehydrogenase E2 component (dihydrolipoyl transacylase)